MKNITDETITPELIGSRLLISKSYCRSSVLEVDILDVQSGFVKLQITGGINASWERISELKIELILKKEEHEDKS